MNYKPLLLAGGIVFAVAVAVFGAVIDGHYGDRAEAGVVTDFTLSVDCDAGTPGIQSTCTYASGASFTAQYVITNNTAGAVTIDSFDTYFFNTDGGVASPGVPSPVPSGFTCNPPA